MAAFVAAVAFAAIGNAIAYILLVRRHLPVRFIWAGTPFYLYRICVRSNPPVPTLLRWFTLATNVAFIAACILAISLSMTEHSPMSNHRLERP
jgi:hypothetical protein